MSVYRTIGPLVFISAFNSDLSVHCSCSLSNVILNGIQVIVNTT